MERLGDVAYRQEARDEECKQVVTCGNVVCTWMKYYIETHNFA